MQDKKVTCVYEKPTWRTCDLAGKDRMFDLDYDVLIVAVCPALDLRWLMLNSGSADVWLVTQPLCIMYRPDKSQDNFHGRLPWLPCIQSLSAYHLKCSMR